MTDGLLAKIHGATTHFPIALTLSSWALDLLGLAFAPRRIARDFHSAGFWALAFAALGTAPAVWSGLLLTKGSVLGHGLLRKHHLFVWPSFALIVALAVWRARVRDPERRWTRVTYIVAGAVAAGLVSAAGYWGGELVVMGSS